MKVLHIIDSLGLGGAQSVVKGIFEAQQDNSDIYLFALRERSVTTPTAHPNVTIYPSSNPYSLLPLLKLRTLIARERIEVLHCHLLRSNVLGWLLKLYFPHLKLIVHEHSGVVEDGWPYSLFLRLSRRSVDRYIAVSRAMAEALQRAGVPQEKITILYNFVDIKQFDRSRITWSVEQEKDKLAIAPETYVVGFAGRLVARKGWREFVRTAAHMAARGLPVTFLIAGDGKEKGELLRTIEAYRLEQTVRYLGRVENMVWFYSLLDCFVMPSWWEGMPVVQLEVMSLGIPLITNRGPGLDEVVEDKVSGFYSKNDPALLSEMLVKLYHERAWAKEVGERARRRMADFTQEKYLDAYRALIENA